MDEKGGGSDCVGYGLPTVAVAFLIPNPKSESENKAERDETRCVVVNEKSPADSRFIRSPVAAGGDGKRDVIAGDGRRSAGDGLRRTEFRLVSGWRLRIFFTPQPTPLGRRMAELGLDLCRCRRRRPA